MSGKNQDAPAEPVDGQPPPAPAVKAPGRLSRDNPNYLLNLFNILMVASSLAIFAAAGLAIYWIFSTAMLRNAETTVASVGKAILSAEVDHLLVDNADGSLRLAVAAADLARMDAQMRRYLKPFGLLRIVVFDADRRIIYSTDNKLIGRAEPDNAELDYVITQGKPRSEIVDRRKAAELGAELLEGTTFVESHWPILDARGRGLGALEIYVDISRTRTEILEVMTMSMAVIALVLAICMFSLYRPMKRGTLSLIAAHRELHEIAMRDHLTGIFNRRCVSDFVKQEFHRWRRSRATTAPAGGVGIVMADIDHFKKINDTYGHGVGDEVLKEVARRIGDGLRGYDVLGRYGGEEFLVLLPNADPEEAAAVANRLCRSVGDYEIQVASGARISVTVSFGVACTGDEEVTEQEIIDQADQALYQAKAEGRDRVVVYRPGTAGEA